MKAAYERNGVTLYHGDVLAVLPTLPAWTVQCVVTSPPYFALRSYLPKGDPLKPLEIGSEPTPEAFIQTMVAVFREVRRVLREDGTCFINLGDSYNQTHSGKLGARTSESFHDCGHAYSQDVAIRRERGLKDGLDAGHLLNIPHRVAEALRADGWIWRQTIVWSKRSPMPESVSGWRWVRCRVKARPEGIARQGDPGGNGWTKHGDDLRDRHMAQWLPCPGCPKCEPHGGYVLRRGSGRCTTAHEYVFVMAKTGRYFWDGEASKESATSTSGGACVGANGNSDAGARRVTVEENAKIRSGSRNPRTVWTLSSEPTKVRHFATFPSELVRRCLVAGVSAGGCCPHCGAPWAPVVESGTVITGRRGAIQDGGKAAGGRSNADKGASSWAALYGCGHSDNTVLGYRPTCSCPPHESIGCLCLDPFNGIGTTGQTAIKLGCRYIGIDLNREYLDVAAERIFEPPRWWLRQQKPKAAKKPAIEQGVLFS